LVDRPSGFGALPFDGAGHSQIGPHALSGDGCFAVFESTADSLLSTDEDAVNQSVYRVDRCTPGNPIVQVNTTASGTSAEADSSTLDPTISSDGRRVAFVSDSRALGGGATSGGRAQVFVKDLQTGALEIASRGTGQTGDPIAVGNVERAVITGSGNQVVFNAQGPFDGDNADGGTATETDLYVRDLLAHTTHMLSVTTGGSPGHGVDPQSFDTDDTASRVVFTTSTRLDSAADTDTGFDAYVRQRIGSSNENTQLVSVSPGATRATLVALSPESVFVAYSDFNHVWFSQCTLACGTPSPADVPRTGGSSTGTVPTLFFAPNAGSATTRVYWLTTSHLEPADADTLEDLYARDLADTNANTAVHLLSGGRSGDVFGADSTDNGAVILLGTADDNGQVLARAGAQDSVLTHPPGRPFRPDEGSGSTSGPRAVSDDGRFVAFESLAPVFGGSSSVQQVLVRDVVSGATSLASVENDGTSPANGVVLLGGIDAAGDRVVFSTPAGNIVPGVNDGKSHVYVRDLSAGTTRLVDRTGAGNPSGMGAFSPRISGDGRRVAFSSSSTDLPAAPFDTHSHIYMVDLEAGTSVLVDQTNNGIPGNGFARNPDIDGSGRHVTFHSDAANLPGGTTGAVYVRDVEATTTTWVSIPEDGNPTHQFIFDETSISRDGRRVAFVNASPDFGYGAVLDSEAFVRDLDAGTTVLASRGPLGPANEGAHSFSLSGDGTKLAFDTFASNLEGANGHLQVYLRDLSAGTTAPASLRDGSTAPGRLNSTGPSLNGDGSCLAFTSRADDLVSPSYGPDFVHVFLRALSADCPRGSPADGVPPPPPGGSPPPLAGARDTPPVMSGARVTNKRFAVAPQATVVSAKAKPGTKFLFSLSENARTTITISRRLAGRRKGRRCVKPRKSLKKRCTRLVRAGTLTRSKTKAGKNSIAFSGRLGRKALRPGAYQASLVATDAAGQKSTPRVVKFSVVGR
jgi:Tol biopolymer transport system component